ncbi:hypothetical protein B0T21DRAFT_351428 [Apiosordaria backusii]|uniref:Uncharacterized protein n=1 Tax=Apiosordaria backusii TaxID=314023 RepID=A0AA40AT17_9PEZI|nr:hypothetical protein B0T21DRAFT_351428 [Apiosordaria backusii]
MQPFALLPTAALPTVPPRPFPFQHSLMIPRTNSYRSERADKVGDDIVDIKLPTVGEETLEDLGADAEADGADAEGEVEGASAGGVDYPVEGEGEEEEGEEVEGFVVEGEGGGELEGGEAGVGGEEG